MAKEIVLQASSRYTLTSIHSKNGKTYFGITRFPDIRLDGDEPIVAVSGGAYESLMHISNEEYGVVNYWWAIAKANRVMNPIEDLPIGTALVIPKIENIRSSIGASSNA